jgi:MFS family permease
MAQEVFMDEKVTSISSNKAEVVSDDGFEVVESTESIETEKKLVRKINYTLLPFVCICVIMQFIDKATLGISAVLGIITETGMTGSQYSWLGSFMYLGYIAAQLPNNYLMQKIPIAKYLGTVVTLWGLVMALTSLCNSFGQLVACRVLLGVFETASYPCLLIVVNAVYRRSEQPSAYNTLWISNGVGVMISSLGAYGISFINDAHGIKTWKWPYIIWGVITVAFGISVFFFFPDSPKSKWYKLTPEEEKIVDARTRDNAIVRVKEFKWHHIWEALKEPRLYLLCVSSLCNNFQNAGLVSFSSIIVEGLGFTVRLFFLVFYSNFEPNIYNSLNNLFYSKQSLVSLVLVSHF